MQNYWIQFNNGYTSAAWRFTLNMLGTLAEDAYGSVAQEAHNRINTLVIAIAGSETVVEAEHFLDVLVGLTEGLTMATSETQVEQRIYNYMYDMLSLAYIVPYADRLDD